MPSQKKLFFATGQKTVANTFAFTTPPRSFITDGTVPPLKDLFATVEVAVAKKPFFATGGAPSLILTCFLLCFLVVYVWDDFLAFNEKMCKK